MTSRLPGFLSGPARTVLGVDEQALAGARVAPSLSGVERITDAEPAGSNTRTDAVQPAEQDDPTPATDVVWGVVVAVAASAVAPTGWSGGDLPQRALGGYAVIGTDGSVAARLHELLSSTEGSRYLLVSDRRMVLCGGRIASDGLTLDAIASVPRSDVVAARRRGRIAARGRLELYFRDGSMLAVMTGVLSTRRARNLLAALGLPERPPV